MFQKKLGNKTEVCKALSIDRSTLYDWIEKDDALRAAIEAQSEANIDFVESKLFELVEGVTMLGKGDSDGGESPTYVLPPNVTAIIFFLKTKGKARGYVEKQEIEQLNKGDITVKVIRE